MLKKLACLKSNMRLCGSKGNNKDYEVVSYGAQQPPAVPTTAPPSKVVPIMTRKPVYNSTQLDADDDSQIDREQADTTMNISHFPLLVADASPEQARAAAMPASPATPTHHHHNRHFFFEQHKKLTSTHIQPVDWSVSDQPQADSIEHSYQLSPPTLSQIEDSHRDDNDDTFHSAIATALSQQGDDDDETLGEFRQVNPSFFHSASDGDDELYVCCVSYVAKNNIEITLDYADRVKLIYDRGDAMLVQNVVTGRCGYAPSVCLVTVQTFLDDLRHLMSEF